MLAEQALVGQAIGYSPVKQAVQALGRLRRRVDHPLERDVAGLSAPTLAAISSG